MAINVRISGTQPLKKAFAETLVEKGFTMNTHQTSYTMCDVYNKDYIVFHLDNKTYSTNGNYPGEHHTFYLPTDWNKALDFIRSQKNSVELELGDHKGKFVITDEGYRTNCADYGRDYIKSIQDMYDTLISLDRRIKRNSSGAQSNIAINETAHFIAFGVNLLSLKEIKKLLDVYANLKNKNEQV